MKNAVKSITLVIASLWVGFQFSIGLVVAPYLFALAARNSPAVPNTGVAADLIGPLLYGSDVASLVVGAGLVVGLTLLRRWGEVPCCGSVLLAEIGSGVAAVTAALNYWLLTPRLRLVKDELAERYGAFHLADKADSLRAQFSTLHQASTALFLVGIAAAMICLVCMTQFCSRSPGREPRAA